MFLGHLNVLIFHYDCKKLYTALAQIKKINANFLKNLILILALSGLSNEISGCTDYNCIKKSATKYFCNCSGFFMEVVDSSECSTNITITNHGYGSNPFISKDCYGSSSSEFVPYLQNEYHTGEYIYSIGQEPEYSVSLSLDSDNIIKDNCYGSVDGHGHFKIKLKDSDSIKEGESINVNDERIISIEYDEYLDISWKSPCSEYVTSSFYSLTASGTINFESLKEPPIIMQLDITFSDDMGNKRKLSGEIKLDIYPKCENTSKGP